MIVTGTWQAVTLTANASTSIQNKDYNYVRVAFDTTTPTEDNIGRILTPLGTEDAVLKFNHTGDNMYVRCDEGTCTIDVEGETVVGTQLGAPTIDLSEGTYFNEIELTLVDTSGESAEIYYTINRINPSRGNGELYSTPFTIGGLYNAGTFVVKAIAIKDGFIPSEITSKTYVINDNLVISELQGVQLWLDADDDTTITEVGGDVSQWDDKSGLDNHATQVTAIDQPTYDSVNKSIDFLTQYMDLATISTKEVFMVVSDVQGSTESAGVSPLLGQSPNVDSNFIALASTGQTYTITVDGGAGNSGNASINNDIRYSGGNIECDTPTGYIPFPNQTTKDIVNFDLDTIASFDALCFYDTGARRSGNIKIYEVIILDKLQSQYKRDSIYKQLRDKWGA